MTNPSIPYLKLALGILFRRFEEPKPIRNTVLVRPEDGYFFVSAPSFVSPDEELRFSPDPRDARVMDIDAAKEVQEALEHHHNIVTVPTWAGRNVS